MRYDKRIAARPEKDYRKKWIVWSIKPLVRPRKERRPGVNIWRDFQ
jgi:hypothetical protein